MTLRQRNAFLDRAAVVRRLQEVGEATRAGLLLQNKHSDLQRLRGELAAQAHWMPPAMRDAVRNEIATKTQELQRPRPLVMPRIDLGGSGLRYPPVIFKKKGKKAKK
jgi:hypothetical protein